MDSGDIALADRFSKILKNTHIPAKILHQVPDIEKEAKKYRAVLEPIKSMFYECYNKIKSDLSTTVLFLPTKQATDNFIMVDGDIALYFIPAANITGKIDDIASESEFSYIPAHEAASLRLIEYGVLFPHIYADTWARESLVGCDLSTYQRFLEGDTAPIYPLLVQFSIKSEREKNLIEKTTSSHTPGFDFKEYAKWARDNCLSKFSRPVEEKIFVEGMRG